MKKIFAVALAVVMVFAISATAFAAIGFPAVSAPSAGISVDVVGLEATTGYFQTNSSTYLKYDQTRGVVAGTELTYMVTLTLARNAGNTWIQGEELYVGTENVNPANGRVVGYCTGASGAVQTLPAAANPNGWDATDLAASGWVLDGSMGLSSNDADMWVSFDANAQVSSAARAQTLYLLISGTKVAETKNAVIHASMYDVSTSLSHTASSSQITISKNGKNYLVTRTTAPNVYGSGNDVSYDVQILTGAYAGVRVAMEGKNTGDNRNYQCTSVYVDSRAAATAATYPTRSVYIVGINNLIVDFAMINNPSVFIGAMNPNYAGLKGALDEVLGIFGFTFDELRLLNNAGFEAYAGSSRTVGASWTYYAYTSGLTVTGPSTVPDTGDVSFAGFALIALSAILDAALILKKVRA